MKWLTKALLLLAPLLMAGSIPFVHAQDDPAPPAKVIHGRGHVTTKHLASFKAEDAVRHAALVKSWKKATQTSFDLRTTNVIGPIKDQSQCGSCWDFSGTCLVESCQFQAGALKNDGSGALSEQYTLDCGSNGGCNGDDNTTVLAWGKATGIPTTAAYGPYTSGNGRTGRCKYTSSMKLYKVPDWGFCDGGQGNGVTKTDQIKTAMVNTGLPIGSAVAAGPAWDNYTTGIYVDSGNRGIDHDVVLVGWQDYDATHVAPPRSKSTGYWIMRNSWGTGWGADGYMMMEYGADAIGTEAVYVTPLTPVPPTPPVPVAGAPAISSALTAIGTIGSPFSYQITASNNPTAFAVGALPAGLSASTTGLISGTPQTAGTSAIIVSAANTSGAGTAVLSLTVTAVAPPTPPGPLPGPGTATLVLTPEQVQSVIQQGVGDISVGELLKALEAAKKQKATPVPPTAPQKMPEPDMKMNRLEQPYDRQRTIEVLISYWSQAA